MLQSIELFNNIHYQHTSIIFILSVERFHCFHLVLLYTTKRPQKQKQKKARKISLQLDVANLGVFTLLTQRYIQDNESVKSPHQIFLSFSFIFFLSFHFFSSMSLDVIGKMLLFFFPTMVLQQGCVHKREG